MKYPFAFTGFACGLAWAALHLQSSAGYLLFWPVISCCVIAVAYATKRPQLMCGKKSNGKASWFWLALNLPWLLFSWTTWLLLACTSREQAINQIAGTNIFISRWPIFGVDLRRFEIIIDLAAEFPRFYQCEGYYESVPNLDGVALVNFLTSKKLTQDARVLVHCAQGHGRSAAFITLLLGRLGLADGVKEGIAKVTKARTLAKMASGQLRHVEQNFHATSVAMSGVVR